MTGDEPDPTSPTGSPDDTPRQDDGLELARQLARATKGGSARARRARRNRGGSPRPGRSATSGAHPDDRDPQTLDTTLEKLVSEQGWDLDIRVQGVFARWPDLVGPDVGAHSRPEALTDGKLVVRAESTAWATQLRLLAPAVVRRLNEELGHGTVTVIEVLGPHVPSWKKGPRSVRDGRGPRDTYG